MNRKIDPPLVVRRQLERCVAEIQRILSGNLMGIYLHGSLAMGCFNPESSDLDILVRVREPIRQETCRELIEILCGLSGAPSPIELSVLTTDDLFPWRHPCPYTLHFGEDWRATLEKDLRTGSWRYWSESERVDPDLAAHITVLHARGRTLLGIPINEAFPAVPRDHYIDSILADFRWARERIDTSPVYGILNMCRVLQYLRTGCVSSKAEAGRWAVSILPDSELRTVRSALSTYQGESNELKLEPGETRRFVTTIEAMVREQRL